MHSKPLAKLRCAIPHLEHATKRLHEALCSQRALTCFGPDDNEEWETATALEVIYIQAEKLLTDVTTKTKDV